MGQTVKLKIYLNINTITTLVQYLFKKNQFDYHHNTAFLNVNDKSNININKDFGLQHKYQIKL